MATLKKRESGFWYVIYRNAAGKQKWVKGYTDQRKTQELANKLENEKTSIKRGDIDPDHERRKVERAKPIAQLIEQFADSLRAGGCSDNHVSYTSQDVENLVNHAGIKYAIDITRTGVDRWVLHLVHLDRLYREWESSPEAERGAIQGDRNSARTINRRIGSVQSFLLWAKGAGAVNEYVLFKYPKREVRGQSVRKSRVLADDEIKKLLMWSAKNYVDQHDLYQFALLTGFRAEECQSMTPAAFDFEKSVVTVHSNDPTQSDRVDTLRLHSKLQPMLKKRCRGKSPAEGIFKGVMGTAKKLREDCVAAGIDPTDVTFHGLRHTFITRLARKGAHPKVTMTLARHKNLNMTLNYYTHWTTADEEAALNLL